MKHIVYLMTPLRVVLFATIFLWTSSIFAADIQVKGRVVDESGEPLIGVSVVVKGSAIGIATDIDGRFSLKVPEKSKLNFSYVGYTSVSLPASPDMEVTMKEDTQNLDEVVVVGYGTQKKGSVTGSVTSLDANAIADIPGGNLASSLAGRLSGVMISSTTGKPGAGSTLSIRAQGTTNDASPLYVIDGVIRNKEAIEQLDKDGYGLNAAYDGTWASNTGECELSKEVIFASRYLYPSRYSDIIAGIRPLDYSQGATGFNCPTVELVMAYPMSDGSAPGVEVDGDGVKEPFDVEATDARGLYWLNRDPRFYKTIVTNGMVYKIVDNGWPGQRQYTYKGGEVETANASRTGFYSCKFVNLTVPKVDIRKYDLDLVELRYAEVMLNLAECAAETGRDAEAVSLLKDIRKRAGITPNDDNMYGLASNLTGKALIDAVMLERRIELAYEGKRFWDMRRRMMFNDPEYQGFIRHSIEISLTPEKKNLDLSQLAKEFNDNGEINMSTTEYFKYFTTKLIDIDSKYTWDVTENHYFFALPKRHLEQNKLLEQTKGWNDGTFDPLL